jgi:glycosyltransferase involved in cell wall biosynthesis
LRRRLWRVAKPLSAPASAESDRAFAWITSASPGTAVARVGAALTAEAGRLPGFRRVAFDRESGGLTEREGEGQQIEVARGFTRLGKTAFVLSLARRLPAYRAAFVDTQNLAFLAPPRACLFLHDLFYLTHPNSMAERLQGKLLYRNLNRYDAILCNSGFTRGEAIRLGLVDPGRVEIFPLAVDGDVFRYREVDRPRLRASLGLPEGARIIAHVSSGEPRKNFPGLLRAFARLASERNDVYLVKAGRDLRARNTPEAEALARDLGIADRVRFLGRIDDARLAEIYSGADCFAFPSFAEGFGLPVLEAQACGCPVVTSDTTSLPEVSGPLCRAVDPHDTRSLAAALGAQLDDPGLRTRAAPANKEFLSRFSWEPGRRFLADFFLRYA